MTNKDNFEKELRAAHQAELGKSENKRNEMATVNKLLKEHEAEALNIAAQLSEVPVNGIVGLALKERVTTVEKSYASLKLRKSELEANLNSLDELTEEDIVPALRFRETVLIGLEQPTFEDKREMLERLKMRVAIDGEPGFSTRPTSRKTSTGFCKYCTETQQPAPSNSASA